MSFLQNFFQRFVPVVRADDEEEELVDPQTILRDKCRALETCVKLQEKLNTCNDRVNSRKHTEETCVEEIIDYVECVDHCVSKKLFDYLK